MVAITDTLLFANNKVASLNNDVLAGDVSIVLASGQGAGFPVPAAGQYFAVTLQNLSNGQIEVCYCTGRSGDLLSVQRAQEGTTAVGFPSSTSVVQMRVTKGILEKIIQKRFDGTADGKYLKVQADGNVIPDIPGIDGGASPGNNYFYGTNLSGAKGWLKNPLVMRGAAFVSTNMLVLPVAPVALHFARAATIRRVVILGDVVGDVTINIAKQTLGSYTAPGGATICGTDFPALVGVAKSDKTVFTGWTLDVAADDVLTISVTAVALLKRVIVQIFLEEALA